MGGKAIAPPKVCETADSHDLTLQIQEGSAERLEELLRTLSEDLARTREPFVCWNLAWAWEENPLAGQTLPSG
jgi:hypothetical protein